MSDKTFLGDSVYAVWDESPWGLELILTTENSNGPTNTIVLNEDVWRELLYFIAERDWLDFIAERNCRWCNERHQPDQPCWATRNTICRCCGRRGHFECSPIRRKQ